MQEGKDTRESSDIVRPFRPLVSVIIASYNARNTIGGCLDSLGRQPTAHAYEVVIGDSSEDGTDGLIRTEYPWVHLMRFGSRTFPGPARNAAVEASQGELLAFVDADCTVAPDWIDRIVAAHRTGKMVIGGAVINGTPGMYIGTAEYLTEFSEYSPRQPPRNCRMIPTCNLSLRRELFDAAGGFEQVLTGERLFKSEDLLLCHRLQELGYFIRFHPDIQIYHHNRIGLKQCLMNQLSLGFSSAVARRVSPMVGAVLLRHVSLRATIPLIKVMLIGRRMARDGLAGFLMFLFHIPLIFLGCIYYAIGFSHGVRVPIRTRNTHERL